MNARVLMAFVVAGLGLFVAVGTPATAGSWTRQGGATIQGNAERGREHFLTYKCYACHGYGAEAGSPRLVPMRLEQAAFLAFVAAGSPSGAMPSYGDAPPQVLADIYAYIRSIPPDTAAASDIPLLEGILQAIEDED